MRASLVLIVVLAGCAGGKEAAPVKDPIQDAVERWLAAKTRAWQTRTHATMENPRAQADADRIEADLKREDRAKVRAAIAQVKPQSDEQRSFLAELAKRMEGP